MKKTIFKCGNFYANGFHAEVPFLKMPKIEEEKIVEGVRIYIANGKEHVADLFDKMFKKCA